MVGNAALASKPLSGDKRGSEGEGGPEFSAGAKGGKSGLGMTGGCDVEIHFERLWQSFSQASIIFYIRLDAQSSMASAEASSS